jgi:hypothetical protein
MTEAEWLACDDWRSMLDHVRENAGTRKLLLLAVAFCRRIWDHFPFDDCRHMVEAVERLADHPRVNSDDYSVAAEADAQFTALQEGYSRVHEADEHRRGAYLAAMTCGAMWHNPIWDIDGVADVAALTAAGVTSGAVWNAERQTQAFLLQDLIGNPFHPVTFDPLWRSETVVALAAAIYAERAFDRLPILADALEEAGCDHADLLPHCREPGPHARGCWAVDTIIEKE